jgi:hypothetical protein
MEKKIKSISVEVLEKLLQKYKYKIGFEMIELDIINFWSYDRRCPGKEKQLGMRRLVE